MEQKLKVKPNQSFLDVILQSSGTMEVGMQMAMDNDWPISYLPVVGTEVAILPYREDDIGVLSYLQKNGHVIGTKGAPAPASLLITEDTEETIVAEDGSDIFAQEE